MYLEESYLSPSKILLFYIRGYRKGPDSKYFRLLRPGGCSPLHSVFIFILQHFKHMKAIFSLLATV